MLKNKFVIILLLGVVSLSSCGIFHKGCNCPKFGEVKPDVQMCKYADVQMC
jgi:hypothetical protein